MGRPAQEFGWGRAEESGAQMAKMACCHGLGYSLHFCMWLFFAAYCMASFKTQPKRPRSPLFWPRGFFGGGNMMTVQRPRGHPTNIYIYISVCVCPHLLRMVSRCFTRNFRQPPARDLVWLAVELARVLQGCMHSDKSMRHRTISVQFRHLGI